MTVGLANALVLRLSFTGELGYEIYMPADEQLHVYETLLAAGAPLGLRHFGLRALNSLRLEKGYGTWGREYSSDYTPDEAGLSRFVRVTRALSSGAMRCLHERSKPARPAARLARDRVLESRSGGRRAGLRAWPADRAPHFGRLRPHGGNARWVLPTFRRISSRTAADVQVLSQRLPARILREPPYDPQGLRLRA